MGETRNTRRIVAGKSEGKRPFRDLRLDERIILKRNLGKYQMNCIKVTHGKI
jgi:hypothetical protein